MDRQLFRPAAVIPVFLALALAAPAEALTGPVEWESVNYPMNYLRHQNGRARMTPVANSLDVADGTFIAVPGLASSSGVSFQSTNFPGSYLRHRNGEVWLDPASNDPLYKADATFTTVPGLSDSTAVSLQSYNFPGSYLRHQNGLLYLSAAAGANGTFAADATFRPIMPVVNGVSAINAGQIMTEGQYLSSPKKRFFAALQPDGNLCVYAGADPSKNAGAVWCAGSARGAGLYYAAIQPDANLCIYTGRPGSGQNFVWCSNSGRAQSNFMVQLLDDSHLGIFPGRTPLDASSGAAWTAPGWSPTQLVTYLQSIGALTLSGTAVSFQGKSRIGLRADALCGTLTYDVPAGVTLLQIKATGGTGQKNVTTVANDVGSGSHEEVGRDGGRGVSVTAFVPVTPGQTLYVVPASNGFIGGGFPGGGLGVRTGGGASFVSTVKPVMTDQVSCQTPQANLLVVAGGGGGAGSSAFEALAAAGGGGDAGLLGQSAGGGQNGSGINAGTGGGGGTPTGGGAVGTHPGCGTEKRFAGAYMRGSENDGQGGCGGGGLWGGGGGGGSCILPVASPAGGGGGSSYVTPNAALATSVIDTTASPGITIQPATY